MPKNAEENARRIEAIISHQYPENRVSAFLYKSRFSPEIWKDITSDPSGQLAFVAILLIKAGIFTSRNFEILSQQDWLLTDEAIEMLGNLILLDPKTLTHAQQTFDEVVAILNKAQDPAKQVREYVEAKMQTVLNEFLEMIPQCPQILTPRLYSNITEKDIVVQILQILARGNYSSEFILYTETFTVKIVELLQQQSDAKSLAHP